jgi:hypothetical protein
MINLQDCEYELNHEEVFSAEVINLSSIYFGYEFYFTHKAVAGGKEWFRSHVEGSNGMGSFDVWFAEEELGEL